jgi:hypothetical protein
MPETVVVTVHNRVPTGTLRRVEEHTRLLPPFAIVGGTQNGHIGRALA